MSLSCSLPFSADSTSVDHCARLEIAYGLILPLVYENKRGIVTQTTFPLDNDLSSLG